MQTMLGRVQIRTTVGIVGLTLLVAIGCWLPSEAVAEKEIPMTRLGQQTGPAGSGGSGPTLTILYCYQCGYRKAFEEYSRILQQNYPQLFIVGDNYNPRNMAYYLSTVITLLKFALIAAVFSATNVWTYFGRPTPGWFEWCQTNKLYACMMFFFVGNMLEGQLIASGAFEISLNDVPIWSKIEIGRVPAPLELIQILDGYLKLEDKVPDFDV